MTSSDLPVKLLTTELDWDDLAQPPEVLGRIRGLAAWVKQPRGSVDDCHSGLPSKPGYSALFHGPPGTGKTLAATLIGASVEADVYRVELSTIISKYIGETEKNLANLFDLAESNDWILFFDEADSLFGKRTQVQNSHDRHANLEASYLLQRIEEFPGVVIFATNRKSNIDEAFLRRFRTVICFAMPKIGG